jgi:hypothetical protein
MSPKILATTAVVVAALSVAGGAQSTARSPSGAPVASGDVVVQWNATMVNAIMATATLPQPGTRIAAIVQTAVFDAVNGITRR